MRVSLAGLHYSKCLNIEFTTNTVCHRACELRLFLIYIGPIVLNNIEYSRISTKNFKSLNVAMIILLSPGLAHLVNYAKQLSKYLIKIFVQIYGSHFVSHNIYIWFTTNI